MRGRVEGTHRAVVADGVILCLRFGEEVPLVELCRAAARGGLTVMELTLTTPSALRAIATLAKNGEGLVVGAGTVLDVADVHRVAEAGGRFVLSPVFDEAVVAQALALGLLPVPGAATPTEILRASRFGAPLVKVFPAGPLGGPELIAAIRGPLPHIPLVATSGPTKATFGAYLRAGVSAVGVGREVFAGGLEPAKVEAAAREVRDAMDRARASVAPPCPAPPAAPEIGSGRSG